MTDPSTNTTAPVPAVRRRRKGRTVFFVALIALAAGLTGAFASSALSQHGFGFGPPGWHGRGFMGRMDPAQIEERILLRGVTPEVFQASVGRQINGLGVEHVALPDSLHHCESL